MIQIEIKKRVNPTGAYASKEVSCNGGTVDAVLIPDKSDIDPRISINVGDKADKIKIIGPITVKKKL